MNARRIATVASRMLLCAAVALVATARTAFAIDRIEIEKAAKTGNPTLVIEGFEGSEEARSVLSDSLYYSDWFDVVVDRNADYRLSFVCRESASSRMVRVQVSDRDSNPVTGFEQKTDRSAALTTLIHSSVDEIIRRVFRNPGFCRSKLAYVKNLDGIKQVWTAQFDGGDPEQLTFNNDLSVEPDWNANGTFLVYTLYDTFSTDIIVLDLVNRRHRRLTRFPGLSSGAAISNNNARTAMTLSKGKNVDLYTMDMTTGQLARLTQTAGAESSPCWSPDDATICYVSDDIGNRPMIYLMPASGGASRRLLRVPVESVSPDWSPVSNRICFSMPVGGIYAVAYIDMNSSDREPEILTSGSGDWESPSWAADGRHIVCSRTFQGQQVLYLVDSLYGKAIPLKNYQGRDSTPSYSN